ncbi:AraC family transcriptional regulator [Neorhizobium alkalisoli]|uniref:AraC family transcriptional regulator n=1 Tax=Neorhizobium alkalisoli TaxID=528178 RepID=UPI001FE14E38|nr:AraC family transcriptional regulator [Neorhizobium alkalisoli]
MSQVRWNNVDQLSFVGTNANELAATLSRLHPATTVFPGGKERVGYEIHMFGMGELSFIASSYEDDLTIRFPGPTDTNMVLIPVAGTAVVTVDNREMLSAGNHGIIADGMLENQTRIIGPRKHLCIRIPDRELIRRLAVRLNAPITGHFHFAPEIDLSRGPGLNLVRLAAMMHIGLADGTLCKSPIALGNLSDAILELLLEAIPHKYSHELHRIAEPPLPRHIKRAIDYMQANILRPITLPEIANACGVSARTLQEGFRNFRMTTPIAYLQHLRLEAAHKDLSSRESGLSVKAVALKWSFAHIGRFSALYRKRFGEFPSRTLRASDSLDSSYLATGEAQPTNAHQTHNCP